MFWIYYNIEELKIKAVLPNGPSGRSTRCLGDGWGGGVDPKSKIVFFGYLLVSEILIKNCSSFWKILSDVGVQASLSGSPSVPLFFIFEIL